MHSSLLKEDLREPKKLAGISDLANHRTRYFNSGRHEMSPGWSWEGGVPIVPAAAPVKSTQ
jgi:hypothetical protein